MLNNYLHNDGFIQIANPYNTTDYYYIMHLSESNHFSYIFDKCINDIFYNYNNYISNDYIDTGWKFDNKTYQINKSSGYNICVRICELAYNIVGTTKQRNISDTKIYISLNKQYSKQILRSFMQHELIHAIKMFADDNKNCIISKKDTVGYDIEKYIKEFNIPKNYQDIVNLLYIMSKTEMEASINATCRFINDLSVNDIHDYIIKRYEYMCNKQLDYSVKNILSKQQQLFNLLTYTKDTHYLNRFLILKELLADYLLYNKDIILFIGYYLHKHKLYNGNNEYLNFNFIYVLMHQLLNDTQIEIYNKDKNLIKECNNIINTIDKIYIAYKKRLYNAVYSLLNNKDAFLSDNDLKYILPYHQQ